MELTVHPGWQHLIGGATELLLAQAQQTFGRGGDLWLRCDVRDAPRQSWLRERGALERGERVLMARSVWRRHAPQPSQEMARRLEAVLGQLQQLRAICTVPLIASGGAGSMEHFAAVFREARVDGALAASVFHSAAINIGELKNYLRQQGVEIRQ